MDAICSQCHGPAPDGPVFAEAGLLCWPCADTRFDALRLLWDPAGDPDLTSADLTPETPAPDGRVPPAWGGHGRALRSARGRPWRPSPAGRQETRQRLENPGGASRRRVRPRTTPGERKEQARMKPPQDKAAGHPQEPGRRPEYVIVTWVSAQLRDRIQRNGASLAEILQVTDQHAPELADPGQEDRDAGQWPPPEE